MNSAIIFLYPIRRMLTGSTLNLIKVNFYEL